MEISNPRVIYRIYVDFMDRTRVGLKAGTPFRRYKTAWLSAFWEERGL